MPAKNKTIYKGQIPFKDFPELSYSDGSKRPARRVQLDYPHHDCYYKDNVTFFARLQIVSMSRGRSAANFSAILSEVEVSENPEMSNFLDGVEVNLFMIDMLDIVTNCTLYAGKTDRNRVFTFCKRGSSYGITRVV